MHNVDELIYGEKQNRVLSRKDLLQNVYPYMEQQVEQGLPLTIMIRHIMGLFHGQPNARQWRRYLSENAYRSSASMETIYQAERLVC